MNINLIAVDEAHCISQWGYDFRPSYLRISAIRDLHPKASVLAVTATATKEVAADIQNHLKFSKENTFSSSFARPNISFQFEEVEAKENSILKHLNPKESSIIYVNTRRQTKLISEHLVRNGFSADYYHAGLDQKDRLKKQEAWTSGQLPAMVSTNAFGMGIDKAAVRKVIHLHIPRSVEAYFQEAGRAGRDGRSSKAILLYYQEDEKSLLANIEKSYPPLSEVRKIYQSLGNYLQLASGAGAFESFDFDLADFSNKMDYHQLEVFNAIQILERAEYIALSEQNWKSSTVQFKTSSRHLIAFQNQHVSFAKLIKALLRTYQHIGQEPTYINEGAIGRQIESSYERVVQLLTSLQKENIIDYVPRSELPQITFLKARLPNAHLSFDHLKYKEQKASKLKSAKAMLRVISSRSCRQRTILAYFGEVVNEDCGHCDNCLSGHAKKVNYEAIIQQIKSLPPGSILEENVDEIVMNYLLDEKVIYRKGPQYLRR